MGPQLPSHRFFLAFRAWSQLTKRQCSRSWYRTQFDHSFPVATNVYCRNHSTAAATPATDSPIKNLDSEEWKNDPSTAILQDIMARHGSRPDLDISTDVRMLMTDVPHPVVVVTACKDVEWPFPQQASPYPDLSPLYTSFCGATVSSFNSVTLGPPPIISFNLRVPSTTLSGILKHKQFRVNVLRPTKAAALIADSFVKGKHEEAFEETARGRHWVGLDNVQPLAARTTVGDSAPFIHGVGIRAVVSCKAIPEKFVEVGDHVIVVAEVIKVRPVFHFSDNVKNTTNEAPVFGSALTYVRRRYRDAMSNALINLPTFTRVLASANTSSSHSDITGSNWWYQRPLGTFGGKILTEESLQQLSSRLKGSGNPYRNRLQNFET